MRTQDVMNLYDRYVMNTYARSPLVLVKGKGSRVWDLTGHEYLDVFPGWGVGGIGHCHPWVMKALRGQSTRMIHVPNTYYHPSQARLAEKLVRVSFDGKVFFANSGAEVVEAAIKLARRWGQIHLGPQGPRYEVVVFEQGFHGRTMGALSATAQAKYQEDFEPLLPGFVCVPFNDLEAVKRAIGPKTVAILIEPIQGEGGVRLATDDFLRGLREVADRHKLLVIVDEIQSGMGRTGRWFAYQHSGIEPDVMVLAKSLAGGFPLGAMVARRSIADALQPGQHGSTFGGNPLACACGLATFEAIQKQGLLARATAMGGVLMSRLKALQGASRIIRDVRGRGLMVGLELSIDGRPIVEACRQQRLLLNCTQGTVLRLLPAITITRAQLERACGILESVIRAQENLGATVA